MPSPSQNEQEISKGVINISKDVRDHGSDPYVVKKALESKKFLDKHGFPKDLLEKLGKK